ncbi:MAG: NPCBM/NEW2 domain-containing protein [Planctomycetes bacterium]|nr:NPCBM/NEW2 domain-containing protein [Planctomycetota bacterium]
MSIAALCFCLLSLPTNRELQDEAKSTAVQATARLRDGSRREVDVATWTPDAATEAGLLILDVRAGSRPVGDALPMESVEVDLVGGERLIGAIVGGAGDDFTVRLGPATSIKVNVDALAGLRFPGRLAAGETAALEPPSSGDRLYRSNGARVERIDGTFEAFSTEGVGFESVLGKSVFAWRDVIALYVENAAKAEREALGPASVCVDLQDGSRLFGRWTSSSARGLELERAAVVATLPWPWIDEVSKRADDFAFLSSLAIAKTDAPSPFGDDLGFTFVPRIDRAVDGGVLTAAGRPWRRGFGVHAPTRLTWRLDGRWKELRGAACIDDQVLRLPSRGSVRFRIHVDGKVAWESAVARGGEAPLEWPVVSLAGAHELVLEVDPTEDLHVADRADWLAPYLVR